MSSIERREDEPPGSTAIEKKKILGDPFAELVILLSKSDSGAHQVVSVVRILCHRKSSPLNMLIDSDSLKEHVVQIITQEMKNCGATVLAFLNRGEAINILNGLSSPLGDVLKRQNFSDVRIVDIRLGQ